MVNVVTHAPGAAPEIADVFFESDDVRVINLIGGVKTARMLAERAGRTLKRTTMELGGYNPMIILDDVDVDYAVRMATFGSFFHQGQICLNTRRIIVQKKIAGEFLGEVRRSHQDASVRRSARSQNDYWTADHASGSQARRRSRQGSGREGREGPHRRHFRRADLSAHDPDERAARRDRRAGRDVSGPVVVVEVVDTAEQAVEAANRTMYGLTSSILAGNTYRAFELAPKILAGIVNVNSPTVNDEIHAPMGGVRDSGWGRTGPDSLKDFQDVIWNTAHSVPRQYPF